MASRVVPETVRDLPSQWKMARWRVVESQEPGNIMDWSGSWLGYHKNKNQVQGEKSGCFFLISQDVESRRSKGLVLQKARKIFEKRWGGSRSRGRVWLARRCMLLGTMRRPECESGEARRGQSNMQCNLTPREMQEKGRTDGGCD